MPVEPINRDRRRRFAETFDAQALALLPGPHHALLLEWLAKSAAPKRRWDSLLLIAGPTRIEHAEALATFLLDGGAAILEEKLARGAWPPVMLIWRDYEHLCQVLGLRTRAVRNAGFLKSWEAARTVDWQSDPLAQAWNALRQGPPDKCQSRLALLIKLNDWLLQGQSGTRRNFSIFARGHSKQITSAEWTWLAEIVELADCGIQRHAPALWLAGNMQLKIGERWLDAGAAGDFMALTPRTLACLNTAQSGATHYRVIENLTSFENLAHQASATEIVLWLPGYAPHWWRAAVGQLLGALPLPARLSCDADPDGVRIAVHAGEVWAERGLAWEPYAMGAEDAAASPNRLPLTERDRLSAERLLQKTILPPTLRTLLEWCLEHQSKAEQENWL